MQNRMYRYGKHLIPDAWVESQKSKNKYTVHTHEGANELPVEEKYTHQNSSVFDTGQIIFFVDSHH